MNLEGIIMVIFTLGVIMVVAGYTNQISPKCNEGVKIKVVPRNVYDEILENQTLAEEIYEGLS
jgi:hypothetical protein